MKEIRAIKDKLARDKAVLNALTVLECGRANTLELGRRVGLDVRLLSRMLSRLANENPDVLEVVKGYRSPAEFTLTQGAEYLAMRRNIATALGEYATLLEVELNSILGQVKYLKEIK